MSVCRGLWESQLGAIVLGGGGYLQTACPQVCVPQHVSQNEQLQQPFVRKDVPDVIFSIGDLMGNKGRTGG